MLHADRYAHPACGRGCTMIIPKYRHPGKMGDQQLMGQFVIFGSQVLKEVSEGIHWPGVSVIAFCISCGYGAQLGWYTEATPVRYTYIVKVLKLFGEKEVKNA